MRQWHHQQRNLTLCVSPLARQLGNLAAKVMLALRIETEEMKRYPTPRNRNSENAEIDTK